MSAVCEKHKMTVPSPEACPGCRWEAEVGDLRGRVERLMDTHEATVARQRATIERQEKELAGLRRAAEWALRGLEQLSREEAERSGSTFELCDFTFSKALRKALGKPSPSLPKARGAKGGSA